MSLHLKTELMRSVAQAGPEPKLFDITRGISIPQLADEAARLALGIRRLVQPVPDKLALFVPNSCNYPVCFYAAQMLGVPAVPLNILLSPRELEAIVDDSRLTLVVAATQFRETIEAFPASLRERLEVWYLAPDGSFDPALPGATPDEIRAIQHEPVCGDPDSLAAILYTSGTTGTPKGVMLTQRNLVTNALDSGKALGVLPNDLCYMLLPLFHSFGLTMTNMHILTGAGLWFEPKFNPHSLLETVATRKVTTVFLTPSFFRVLLRSENMRPEMLDSLRITLSGGAPLPAPLQNEWRERTGHELLNGYGLTETSPVISLNAPHRHRPVSIGPAIPGVEVEVRDDAGRVLPAGEIGELCVRGPNVMKGYLNKPKETVEVLGADGWLRTGDLAYLDPDGFIFLTGRKKELIIYGGQNVLPQEVELAILEYDGISEVAVVGIEDETKGEYPKAFVVLREGVCVTSRELHEFLRPRLAAYKIPRQYEFIDALPKNTLGKVLKRELKKRG